MKRPKKRPTVRRHYTLLHELLASPTEPLPAAHQMHQLTRMWLGLAALETAASCTTQTLENHGWLSNLATSVHKGW